MENAEMEGIVLERRLTRIETAQQAATDLSAIHHATVMQTLGEVKGKVEVQNGRVGKLEIWKAQSAAIYGGILVAAPFVFYGLMRLFGGT